MVIPLSAIKQRINSADLYKRVSNMHTKLTKQDPGYQRPCEMPRSANRGDPVDARLNESKSRAIKMLKLPLHSGTTQPTLSEQQLNDYGINK